MGIEEDGAPEMSPQGAIRSCQGAISAELLVQPPSRQNTRAELLQITQEPGYACLSVPLPLSSPVLTAIA